MSDDNKLGISGNGAHIRFGTHYVLSWLISRACLIRGQPNEWVIVWPSLCGFTLKRIAILTAK